MDSTLYPDDDTGQSQADGAAAAADAVEEGWSEDAYQLLVSHAKVNQHFVVTDVSRQMHCPNPTRRAWGSVARKAFKAGVIVPAGVVKNHVAGTHGSYITLWESRICTL